MNDDADDLLIHRALARTATPAEWSELERGAQIDPSLWRRLALALKDDGLLARAVAIEVGTLAAPAAHLAPSRTTRRPRLVELTGWLAAAASLAFFLFLSGVGLSESRHPSSRAAAPVAGNDLELVSARSVGELPKMMMAAQPAADGKGYEVTYLRRTLERVRVDHMIHLVQDENGRPAAVSVSAAPVPAIEQF